jgi:hypothetical protein
MGLLPERLRKNRSILEHLRNTQYFCNATTVDDDLVACFYSLPTFWCKVRSPFLIGSDRPEAINFSDAQTTC